MLEYRCRLVYVMAVAGLGIRVSVCISQGCSGKQKTVGILNCEGVSVKGIKHLRSCREDCQVAWRSVWFTAGSEFAAS